jgi:cysteine desulfurase/selenocysteine lyase
MDWNKYRSYYPHLNEQIYLNHAAIAPTNILAREAIHGFIDNRLHKHIEFWPDMMEKKNNFISLIGSLIHAPSDNIALTMNTSSGLNILTLGLNWKAGDRILLNDFEFPSNVIPFLNLRRLGVEIDFVQHRDGAILVDDIIEHIHPRTRLLSISFVEFLNGFRNDLRVISEICHQHDIIFSVDAIQGLGALQMNVKQMGIDFLSCGGHKWLMWPASVGFVYIAPRIFDQVYPTQAGWLGLETPFDFFNYDQPFAPTAQRFETGAYNVMGIMGATATLEMMIEIGPQLIENKILSNTNYLIEKLERKGFQLFTKKEDNHRSGIVTFYHHKAEQLFDFLKEHKVTISLREGKIRVSPHFYNDFSDLDRFFELVSDFENK